MKRQDNKVLTDSKEAAAKEQPPEWWAACTERQAGATPTKAEVTSTSTGVPLYPDWIVRSKTKPTGRDAPRPYQAPKEDAGKDLMLEEELDAASVVRPSAIEPTGLPALLYARYHPRGGRAEDTAAL